MRPNFLSRLRRRLAASHMFRSPASVPVPRHGQDTTVFIEPPVAESEPDYCAWSRTQTKDLDALGRQVAQLKDKPLISIILPVHDPELPDLRRALESVEAQVYPRWELCIVDDASGKSEITAFLEAYAAGKEHVRYTRLPVSQHIAGATNAAIALARGEFLAFLDHDDEFSPDALAEVSLVLDADPSTDIVYSDHDVVGVDGARRSPCFKPDWAPELLLSYMYFGHIKVYRTALVREIGGLRHGFEGSSDYDLALRLVEVARRVRHIPKILYHWRAAPASMASRSDTKPQSFESGRRAVEEAAKRRHIEANVEWPPFAERCRIGVYRLRFSATRDVPVTIVIPTKDKVSLLRNCIESIEAKTTHLAYRILIIDNESRERETLDYLQRSPHRVLSFCSHGQFNFAAMMNFGVARAETEFVVLLNNDTLVIAPDWLDEMLGYGLQPNVGAVGSKLLYADGRIQHAGVILGTHGLTGHAFQALPDTPDPGEYLYYGHVARNYLAVTAACMLTNKTAFHAVGGFNEVDLKVAWNDVDYCLKLHEAGYRIVLNPYAVLYHLESQSRGDDKNPAEVHYMLSRAQTYIARDPFYNSNLSCADANFRIRTDPNEHLNYYYRTYR